MTINFRNSHQPERENQKDLEPLLRCSRVGIQVKGIERPANHTLRHTLKTVMTNQQYFCFFVSAVPAAPSRLDSPWRVHRRM